MNISGPEILARTMSHPTKRAGSTRAWQYHSRSDHHSKVACWTIVFDLLRKCDAFRDDAARGLVLVSIKRVLVGPINRAFDLVICRRRDPGSSTHPASFADLVRLYGIRLNAEELVALTTCPSIPLEKKGDVNEVMVALESKACMTKHSNSIARLHTEIVAQGFIAKQAAPHCLTVSHTLVNSAPFFMSAGREGRVTEHSQPGDTESVLAMLRLGVPRASDSTNHGYDAVSASVIDCRNDGSPVTRVRGKPAPGINDFLNYAHMIARLSSAYRGRFRS